MGRSTFAFGFCVDGTLLGTWYDKDRANATLKQNQTFLALSSFLTFKNQSSRDRVGEEGAHPAQAAFHQPAFPRLGYGCVPVHSPLQYRRAKDPGSATANRATAARGRPLLAQRSHNRLSMRTPRVGRTRKDKLQAALAAALERSNRLLPISMSPSAITATNEGSLGRPLHPRRYY